MIRSPSISKPGRVFAYDPVAKIIFFPEYLTPATSTVSFETSFP